jgi:hypothetical protein
VSKKDLITSPLGLKKTLSPKPSINDKINASLSTLKNLENYIRGIKMDMMNGSEAQPAPKGLFSNELNDLKKKIQKLVQIADKH